ncbi:MAG: 6-bladed beta-propeller [Tannerellaceae bacterium]|jgi:hypothetical protein|nr:6-bladed beta-propeller [Tannerellaceae bacterium]
MKRLITIPAVILFVASGCGESRQPADDFITVDVTAGYPAKELVLQDFMDVEYIPLETSDEFITQGYVRAIGKDIILVTNSVNDGNIFIFDRNGKGLRKINRFGQGSEEYTFITNLTLDEDNAEMFVGTFYGTLVYDLFGKFKRKFDNNEGSFRFNSTYNFDRDNLICYSIVSGNSGDGTENSQPFTIRSKHDGSIAESIPLTFKERIQTSIVIIEDKSVSVSNPTSNYPVIPCPGGWIFIEPSSDTVYRYLSDRSIVPILARTPSVHSMDPEVFLFMSIITDRYYFMETVKKENEFPATGLLYDRQAKAIFESIVYNGDYSDKKQVYMNSRPVNNEIATCQPLEAPDLVEAYGNGELKGRLKEVAAGLDEESNPVIMLIKHKK